MVLIHRVTGNKLQHIVLSTKNASGSKMWQYLRSVAFSSVRQVNWRKVRSLIFDNLQLAEEIYM